MSMIAPTFSTGAGKRESFVTEQVNLPRPGAAQSVEQGADSSPTLLVVGAGPKAVAIAAKRHMLAKMGFPVPRVCIIDRRGVAAHWSGKAGYTDGNQFLGTRPEKDVCFPYLSTCWGEIALSHAVA